MNLGFDPDALVIGGLSAARVLSFLSSLPVMGVRTVPGPVRIAIALCMAVGMMPTIQAAGAVAPGSPLTLALALAIEILVGLVLAFTAVTLFATVQFAGEMIGVQMGLALANVVDPTNDQQISTLSQVFNLVAVLVFLAIDGPTEILRAFSESYVAMPPGAFVPSAESMLTAMAQVGTLFSMALRIALPVITALMLVSLTLGIVGRTVPQLNILVLGFPIKILVGVFVISVSVPLSGESIAGTLNELPERLLEVVWVESAGR
mgnify:FL=1